jgi:hypothetical protein
MLDAWVRDLRFFMRLLNRTRGLTCVVVTTLALAIAVNGVVIAFVDRLLFANPEHVSETDSLLRISNSWLLRHDQYAHLEQVVTSLALTAQSQLTEVTLGAGPEAQLVPARFVTGTYFSVLGVRPALGRFFQ